MTYRPELDGLRAIAVLAVILFHSGVSGFSGGYVGVDIFFVLSGYLITHILCQSLRTGRFSLLDFYERRARRLLPALLSVIAFTLIASWLLLPSSYLIETAQSAIATLAFGSNFFFWQQSGYFDTANELKPLLHTWSLAVEEQFYLLFPLLLAIGWQRFNTLLRYILIVITLLSFAWCHWGEMGAATRFYLLPTRLWELMLGALCAIYINQLAKMPVNHNLMTLISCGLLIWAITQLSSTTQYPNAYALAPTLGAAGLIVFAHPATFVGRLLALRPIVHIGLISYSAYLWHQPLLAFWHFYQLESAPLWQNLIFIGLILIVAHVSWRWIEQPFRLQQRISRQRIFRYSALGITALLLISIFINTTSLHSQRQFAYQQLQYDLDNPSLRKQTWQPLRKLASDSKYGVDNNAFDQTPWFTPDDTRPGLLVIGNSYSKDMYNTLLASETRRQRYQLARYGTQINALANSQHPLFQSPNYQTADTLLLASRYSQNDVNALAAVLSRLQADGKRVIITSLPYEFPEYAGKTRADIHYLRQYRSNPAAVDGQIISEAINRDHFDWLAQNSRADINNINQQLQLTAQTHNAIFIDRMMYLCDQQQQCFAMDATLQKFYFDYGHQTLAGTNYFAKRIDAINWLP